MPDTTDMTNDAFLSTFDSADVTEETEDVTYDVEDTEGTEDVNEETTEVTEPEEETIDYTYNHQTTALPKGAVSQIAEKLGWQPEDLITVIQKGSNYDTLRGRQTPYDPAIERIDRFAKSSNLSREDAISRAIDALDIIESAQYVDALKQKYPDAPPQMIQEMAMMQVRQPKPAATDNESQIEADRQAKWVGFFQRHPDVNADSLSPRMLEALENNEDPEYVFVSEQNKQLTEQLKQLQATASKKARTTGSTKKTSGDTGRDPFLDAFL